MMKETKPTMKPITVKIPMMCTPMCRSMQQQHWVTVSLLVFTFV